MKLIIFSFIFLLIPITTISSQELSCTVNINVEGITSAQRDYLRTFKFDIENYLNNTRFTNEDLDGEKIQCNMDIFFKTTIGENKYQTHVVITSRRPIYIGDQKSDRTTLILRISDNNWEFTYTPNQRIIHDEMIFDPLTSFLDFYAYLIIGYDLETYVQLSGSRCFEKALKVVQLGSNAGAKDWQPSSASYSKYGIADELYQFKFNNFRLAFNSYHFDGIDLLATEQKKGLDNILKALEAINDVRKQSTTSVVIKQFFDAKYREIAEIFSNYPDKNVYDKLSLYDPEHRSTYQEWMTK